MSSRFLPDPHPRHCPTHDEVSSSKSRIQTLNPDIEDLEMQIAELQTRLDRLRRERDNHASYVSPFRCLPVEILTDIIHICLENGVLHKTLMRICGRLRDLMIGTPSFWTKLRIVSRMSYDFSQGYHCTTTEQLEFALRCTNSVALDVDMDMTDRAPRSDMINHLISHKVPIRSLNVKVEYTKNSLPVLSSLNLSVLKNISLRRLPMDEAKIFFDLLLQYNQEDMSISVGTYSEDAWPIREHGLLRRAMFLEIYAGAKEAFPSTKISVPRLKSLVLHGKYQLLDSFDLENITSINNWGSGGSMDPISLHILPMRLTTLSLRHRHFTSQQALQQKPHLLPNLVTLHLIFGRLELPLDRYLELPQLKHLELKDVGYGPLRRNTHKEAGEEYPPLSPRVYLPSDPLGLECLTLLRMGTFESFIQEVRFYPKLRRLMVDMDNAGAIGSSLTAFSSENIPAFPVLQDLYIKLRYYDKIPKDLSEYCASRVPPIHLYGETGEW